MRQYAAIAAYAVAGGVCVGLAAYRFFDGINEWLKER